MLAGIVLLLSSLTTVYASQHKIPIEDSTFQDWSAYKHEFALADGSVLTDYAATSFAGSLSDNRIIISFVPRFECVPVISVVVASYITSGEATPHAVSLEIDGRELPFPAIVDAAEEAAFRYSYNASILDQTNLLQQLDVGSRLVVMFNDRQSASVDATTAAVGPDKMVSFSLLGSRKSGLAAKALCEAHTPVPLESNQ
jgi:hypothetical protein